MSTPSPEVVAVLVAQHRRFLGFLERRVGSREAAEDLLQEAFVRGLEHGSALRNDESAVAWFYRVLRNALVDHARRRASERRALDRVAAQAADGADSSTAPAVDAELMDEACACTLALLDILKPEYAAALRQVDLDGSSVQAFAAGAGITPNNASVRLFRAREALRRQVQRACGTCAEHGCLDCACGGPGEVGAPPATRGGDASAGGPHPGAAG